MQAEEAACVPSLVSGVFRAGLAAYRKLSQKRPAEAVEVAKLLSMLEEQQCLRVT